MEVKSFRPRNELPPAADSPGRTVGLADLAGLDGDVGELADGVERLSPEPILFGGGGRRSGMLLRDRKRGNGPIPCGEVKTGVPEPSVMTLSPLGR